MTDIRYKVVRVEDGELVSASASGKSTVRYSTGYFATAPEWLASLGCNLFVFETLEYAQAFRHGCLGNNPVYQVWKCECVGQASVHAVLGASYLSRGIAICINDTYPKGTLCYQQVKLIERMS